MSDNHFIILITVHNAEKYIERCVNSAINQDYDNFDIVVVDDCSTDGTSDILWKYKSHIIIHRNEERVGDSMPNTVMAIKRYSDHAEDIIVHLDGDDALAHNNALNRLNEAYNGNIWITYGQYEPMSHTYHNYCTPIPDHRTYRRSGAWRTSHLKTWKKWLWDKIEDKDLRDTVGNYLVGATDQSFMYPMLEMAGAKHTKFIEEVIYLYNDLNPANYMKERPSCLINNSEYIRSLPLYDEL